MNITELTKIAEYHAKYSVRTKCKFNKILRHERIGREHLFYALYECKRRIAIKPIRLTDKGVYIDNKDKHG